MSRNPIAPGDVDTQLLSMTTTMVDVLEHIAVGVETYGRAIARKLEVPYPQVYHILNVLSARQFLTVEWDDEFPTRKTYTLTNAGRALLDKARSHGVGSVPGERRGPSIHPDVYARRMHTTPVVRWMIRHDLVDSREDLDHIMNCADCDRLLHESETWFPEKIRCDAYKARTHDKAGE